MKKTIFSLIFPICAAFSNSIQAEEVYYQQEDIAYAFELIQSNLLPSKSKFKITATRKLVGVPETKFYTGDLIRIILHNFIWLLTVHIRRYRF